MLGKASWVIRLRSCVGKVIEFIGDPMSPPVEASTWRPAHVGTHVMVWERASTGLKAEEAYLWNAEKAEKVNVATGDVIPILPVLIEQGQGRTGALDPVRVTCTGRRGKAFPLPFCGNYLLTLGQKRAV
jgi:hypothetical protein